MRDEVELVIVTDLEKDPRLRMIENVEVGGSCCIRCAVDGYLLKYNLLSLIYTSLHPSHALPIQIRLNIAHSAALGVQQ